MDVVSPIQAQRYTIPVTNSAEYLEKYQPKTAGATYQKYVARDPEPILDKIKRQRVGGQNMGKVAEKIVKRGFRKKSSRLGNEEYVLDPRREDLNKELRDLFHEE
jgi:hypothetical protein